MRAVTYTYTARAASGARERQREACRAAARAAEMTETAWVHDESGDRSGLARIYELARDGEVDAVLVWSFDRLGRTFGALCEHLAALQAKNVSVIVAGPQATDRASAVLDVMRAVHDQRGEGRTSSSVLGRRATAAVPGEMSHPRRR